MKAIEITAPSELALKEYDSRSLKDNEIRIEVAFCGVCGSDLKNITAPVRIPQIPGHEFSGRVIEAAIGMRDKFQIGDRVTAFPMIACMKCSQCQKHVYRDCPYKQSLGFQLPGAFAEEVILDGNFAVKLLEGISYEQGALVEHLCCGYRLVKEITPQKLPSKDIHILIIGDGPIALADLQNIKAASFSNISLIGKHENRKKMAKKLGASRVVDCAQVNRDKETLQSVDICILAAPAEEILMHIIPLIKPSGIFYPQTRIKSHKIMNLLKTFHVTTGRAFAYFLDDFEAVMTLIVNGTIQTDPLVTERVPLLKVADVFENFYKKENNIKILIQNENLSLYKRSDRKHRTVEITPR